MVIVELNGGLGNQMFQYALYQSFVNKGIPAKIDISKFDEERAHNGYELEKIFNVNGSYCTPFEKKVAKSIGKFLHITLKKPYKEKPSEQYAYNSNILNNKFCFLRGYWQSEKYFKKAENQIRQKFTFPLLPEKNNLNALSQIQSSESVSLHIRRGDYLTGGRNCALNLEYYHQAIDYILQKVSNAKFFIFSDDMEWAQQNIPTSNASFISWNKGEKSFADMHLMTCCKHNIIANSSFSWWGAWLNTSASKIVIAPQQWMPDLKSNKNLIPENWIQLPNKF